MKIRFSLQFAALILLGLRITAPGEETAPPPGNQALLSSDPALVSPMPDLVASSIKDVRVLSPEWVCAVVDPTAEILALREEKYGAELKADREKFVDHWYWPFSQTFRMLNIQGSYHQPLFARFNEPGFWKINGETPSEVTVWSHSVDGFPRGSAAEMPACDVALYSRTADMVYLKPAQPLKQGDPIEVVGEDGRSRKMTFDDQATPCWSIKVNQSAYARTATRKSAYLGQWLPGIGPLDFSAFAGQPFHLKAYQAGDRWDRGQAVGDAVFTGEIKLRKKFADQDIQREGGANATGEDVYELDFTAFQGEGTYCIQIPGLGRSWPFKITADGYGDAFFTMMKGLYIQRCGTELKQPYTAWERPACHVVTKQGQFLPESERWYGNSYRKNETNFGFRNASGERIGVAAFTLIGNSSPDSPVLEDVHGGWHDAADFDRRIHHYAVVADLLAAFEANPARFTDGQLNLPESGNGIPDLLDEAAYGVEVWRKAQSADGGVCSWIEEESHPGGAPGKLAECTAGDPMQMYASVPDRAGSLAYAGAAARLGRLLAPFAPERSATYLESARRAYAWAKDPAHAMTGQTFLIEKSMRNAELKGQTISFDEDPAILKEDRAYTEGAFAAAYLYLATKDEAYLQDWIASGFGPKYPGLAWAISPSQCLPLLLNPGLPEEDRASMKAALVKAADELLADQDAYAYRMLWLAPTAGWFHTMAWGNIYHKARTMAVAYAVTEDAKYKASMEAAADFYLGCNPLGQTMITGVGSVFPVVLQHIHSMSDGIAEPTPGIAPYTFTFGVPMRPFAVVDGGHASVKAYFTNVAAVFLPNQLGRKELQADLDRVEKTGNWVQEATKPTKAATWKNFPVFRRKVTHPTSVVDQNEFTVNETMSPLALLFASLTADHYQPSEALKNRQPRRSIEELPFYTMP